MRLSTPDLLIVVVYLVGITIFGVHLRRGQQNISDYFLGGHTAPWWALAFSIVATETSTLTIIGTPALAYAGDLGFLQLVFGFVVGRIVITLVFLPHYFRGDFYTAYELIEKRFGARMRAVAACTFLATRALAEGVRIAAIALVTSVVVGASERPAVLIVVVLTLLYTFEGGMKAVIWTDVAQLILYFTGSVVAFWLLLHRIPGGWMEITQVAASAGDKLRVFNFALSATQKYTFWSGILGGTFLTMASHGTDQTIVQRLLAARSEGDSKKALLASGVIILVQFTLFLLIGVMLFVFSQHAQLLAPGERTDRIFPTFIVRDMPHGAAGLVIAAIFAVAMSNASGSLNSLAASTVLDFQRLRGKQANASDFLRLSRRMTLFWGVVLLLFGMVRWGPVLEAGLTVASLPFGSLLGLFLLGTIDRRATARGALAGMAAGLATILAVYIFTAVAFTWYVLIGSLTTYVAGALLSRVEGIGQHGRGKPLPKQA